LLLLVFDAGHFHDFLQDFVLVHVLQIKLTTPMLIIFSLFGSLRLGQLVVVEVWAAPKTPVSERWSLASEAAKDIVNGVYDGDHT